MVRQQAEVEHVGVGQHDMRRLPDHPALMLRRVAVVGPGADLFPEPEVPDLPPLILGQGLEREEVERTAPAAHQDPLDHRHVVAERLPDAVPVTTTTSRLSAPRQWPWAWCV
ncbi:MAG: hypothetical protein M5U09_19270 [Gammaproteobacteria bacterium]|nr:hypothetical protein [Gammaproteobacteria bacterium]